MPLFRTRRESTAAELGETATRASEGGRITAIATTVALLLSAYSLYETAIRRPELHTFVPPVIRYSSPYTNSNFEVFEVPVTVVNLGARSGTVLSMDLEVTNLRTKEHKRFIASEVGRWTMDNANAHAMQPFAPLSLPGKSSVSQSVLFYALDDEPVQQVADEKGSYSFKLALNVAYPEDLGALDRLWPVRSDALVFQMEMPEIDHRIFINGTIALHTADWKPSGGGS